MRWVKGELVILKCCFSRHQHLKNKLCVVKYDGKFYLDDIRSMGDKYYLAPPHESDFEKVPDEYFYENFK